MSKKSEKKEKKSKKVVEQVKKEPLVRFTYFKDSKNQPVACVAYVLNGAEVSYAISTLHKGDVFNRAKGRETSSVRLTRGKSFSFSLPEEKVKNPLALLVAHIAEQSPFINRYDNEVSEKEKTLTARAVNGAKRWLKNKKHANKEQE